MNSETFGLTLQLAICKIYNLDNNISPKRVSEELLSNFTNSKFLQKILSKKKPIEYLPSTKKCKTQYIKRCPHNLLLGKDETFYIKTFKGKGKMFTAKVVGQL